MFNRKSFNLFPKKAKRQKLQTKLNAEKHTILDHHPPKKEYFTLPLIKYIKTKEN